MYVNYMVAYYVYEYLFMGMGTLMGPRSPMGHGYGEISSPVM